MRREEGKRWDREMEFRRKGRKGGKRENGGEGKYEEWKRERGRGGKGKEKGE